MAETLQLRLQQNENVADPKDPSNLLDIQLVTGVEMTDGFYVQGLNYDPTRPEITLTLEWPTNMAEKVTEYYEKHLSWLSHPDTGWNCHSFVAEVMDWNVLWSEGAFPYYMPYRLRTVAPDQLHDQVPYAIGTRVLRNLKHSMLGLPDPTMNLGVWGFRSDMFVASNEVTAEHFGGNIYPHKIPRKLGQMARYLLNGNDMLPVSIDKDVVLH